MRWRQVLILLIVVVIAFLLLMPTKVEPVAWTPQAAPSLSEGIYADNQRVARQVHALRAGDFETFLQLVNESGTSSWEYLQNVIPAGYKEHQEVAVTIAAAKHFLNGAGAVRVHGGGFAGTVQAFVPLEKLDAFKAEMEAILGAGKCHILSIRPEGGAVL